MTLIQAVGNKIYEWNQPNRACPVRVGLTRCAGVALGGIEAVSLAFQPLVLAADVCATTTKAIVRIARNICPCVEVLRRIDDALPPFSRLIDTICKMLKLSCALLSTAVLGVVFNPDLNYRLHSHPKIGLINDEIARSKVLKREKLEQDSIIISTKLEEKRLEETSPKRRNYRDVLKHSAAIAQKLEPQTS